MLTELTPEELDEMIEDHEELLILDVRNPEEFHSGHIPGARNQPVRAAGDETIADIDDKTIVLCSAHGERSARAAERLRALGHERVYSLSGGLTRWSAEGMAVVRDPN
jgi:rhodanese-related sulfurtransferase